LFRNNTTTKNKTNLMVFLRPIIVREGRALTGATAEKYSYIRVEQGKLRELGSDFLDKRELPLLPEWKEQLEKIEELQRQKHQSDLQRSEQPGASNNTAPTSPAPTSAPNNNSAPGETQP
jgi:general secretion pathway protein D